MVAGYPGSVLQMGRATIPTKGHRRRRERTHRTGSLPAGVPREIVIMDNGIQFKSRPLAALLTAFDIRHKPSPPYAPHCNLVERANHTIKTMISQFVDRNHRKWDEHLTTLQFAFNTAIQESTGYMPAYLNYGRELRLPLTRARRVSVPSPEIHQLKVKEAFELVRKNLTRAF